MKPEADRWKLVRSIFEEALERTADERGAFIAERCGPDSSLRQEVQALLSADRQADGFLDDGLGEGLPSSLEPGQTVGPYRVLQLLGEGGMGEVYEVEQETPVQRKVALKLVKLGMDTRQIVARFESERQALALMDHPNISRVFDGGATEAGRPYFVMEFVKGVPLNVYCDKYRVDTVGRLELFLQVCDGVHHAHQKGIIHRDIKPSNVLVTVLEDRPVPKIIDFGVAKATGHRLTQGTLHTALGQMVGTPEYMSPEQAEMSSLDIDIRSDVYSLGVLLYELLTGTRPLERKDGLADGIEGMRRRILEDEPPRPSTRVESLGDTATDVAGKRGADVSQLKRQLRGDLDWITMRALEKDRTRRYSSVPELAADVGRHLRHEPVVAGPASGFYRIGKFVRRHRMGVGAALVAALAIGIGVAGVAAGLVQARRAESRALQEAETANRVSQFLADLFKISDPRATRPDSITAQEILERGARQVRTDLSGQPQVQGRLMNAIGSVYLNMGLFAEAAALLGEALAVRQGVLPEGDLSVAESQHQLALAFRALGRFAEAEPLLTEALASRQASLAATDPLVVATTGDLASILTSRGRFAEAEPLFMRALELTELDTDADPVQLANCHSNLGNFFGMQGRAEEAEPFFERALEIRMGVHGGDEHPQVVREMHNLATLYNIMGNDESAERLYRRTLEVQESLYGAEHPQAGDTLAGLAGLQLRQGQLEEAESLFSRSVEVMRTTVGSTHPVIAEALQGLGTVRVKQGRLEEAEGYYRRALAMRERIHGPTHPRVAEAAQAYAELLRQTGRDEQAQEMATRGRGPL